LADQQAFPGPVYAAAKPDPGAPRLSLAGRLNNLLPVRDFVAARAGFAGRFDRAVRRLATEGGSAVPAPQSAFHFAEGLLIPVRTSVIQKRLVDFYFDGERVRWIGAHFLDGGDWAPISQPVTASSSHREILELCKTRQGFRKGRRYLNYAKRIADGTLLVRNRIALDTTEKLDSYFEYYLALIEDIEKNGIVPQSALGLSGQTGRHHRWTRSFWQDFAERDIGVAIDADGSLVRHTNGKHRMAAAIALGVESIPVEIRRVHAGWLQRQSERLGLTPSAALLATVEEARAKGWQAG
jgi:hypothetical protein